MSFEYPLVYLTCYRCARLFLIQNKGQPTVPKYCPKCMKERVGQ